MRPKTKGSIESTAKTAGGLAQEVAQAQLEARKPAGQDRGRVVARAPLEAKGGAVLVLVQFRLSSSTTSASIQKAGRQKASIEPPLIPTQPPSGPWGLVRGLGQTISARLPCRGCAYMAV